MNVASLRGPVRTAVLGSRLTPSALTPFRFTARSIPSYKCQNAFPTPSRRSMITASPQTPRIGPSRVLGSEAARTLRPSATVPSSPVLPRIASRANSTSTTSSAAASTQPTAKDAKLDWNSFFKLRTSRRRYSLVSSIVTATATTSVGMSVLATQSLETLSATFLNLDPFLILGISVAVFLSAGWLTGPFLGNGIWGLVNRRYKPAFTSREKEFYYRIRRYRVDPSNNSMNNPVPDYYGEKIGSVQGYRQWLKDQRAYNRKRRSFIA